MKRSFLFAFIYLLFSFFNCGMCTVKDGCVVLPIDKDWIEKRYQKRDPDKKMQFCVVIHNFGLNESVDRKILDIIPKEFSVSITPYNLNNEKTIDQIKSDEHDLLFVQPLGLYQDTLSSEDPFRLDSRYDQKKNKHLSKKTLSLTPNDVVGIVASQASPVLKDETALTPLLEMIKEKKIPFISPEMAIDPDFRNICKRIGVECYEADYYIPKNIPSDLILELLEKARDLAQKTGNIFLIVDAEIQNVKEVIFWLQKFPQNQIKLISFKEYLNVYRCL